MFRRFRLPLVLCLALTFGFAQEAQQPRRGPAAPADILPADNLIAEGIPPIPASIAEGVGRYTEFRAAGFSSWHPTKREMLIGTRFGDVPQIHRVSTPGGARTQLTFFPDRVGGARYPRHTDKYFVFTKDVGGGEWFQLYRYDTATGDITLLTDGKSRNTPNSWSRKGDLLTFTSTKRTGRDADIYVMDPLKPEGTRMVLQVQGGGWGAADWSPDDQTLAVIEFLSAEESKIWLVNAQSGEKKLATPEGKAAWGDARFSSDGKGLYLTTDSGSEFSRLAYLDLATRKLTVLTPDINWDVDGYDMTEDGKRIVFRTNEDGVSKVYTIATTPGAKPVPVKGIPVGIIGGLNWHNNGKEFAFNMSSAQSTGDVYSTTGNGTVERWTFSETGGLNTASFSAPQLIKWQSFDGKQISGFYYKPPAKYSGKRPVVISIHGGPEAQARPGFLGRTNYYINELGLAFIYPNVRGSTGYGKTFLSLDNGMKREDTYKDIAALIDWIKQQPDLDGDKIMVTGGSYGGHMTFAIATYYNDKVAATLPVVGISNFITFLQNTESYRRDLRRVEYGDERDPKMKEFFERTAPLNNAQKITKPMFIVQGQNDPRVPASESVQIHQTLKKNNTPVWFLMAKDEGHGFAKKKNQDYQFYATVMFMKKYLLGENVGAPAAGAPAAKSE